MPKCYSCYAVRECETVHLGSDNFVDICSPYIGDGGIVKNSDILNKAAIVISKIKATILALNFDNESTENEILLFRMLAEIELGIQSIKLMSLKCTSTNEFESNYSVLNNMHACLKR